ncbi:MAG TPA: hypothetical protein DCK97_06675 [Tistrella mobilis]|uniref:DUF403 domain-containing protein n=1 Tax=Tistrella mobilis TaxID=171437 RepID=A0A3B9IH95_9PROT|nr:hypothetical protein [Tistrella mobilis]
MLSRTADNIYWLSRNMERAENLARIIEDAHRMALLPSSAAEGGYDEWKSALISAGVAGGFVARHGEEAVDQRRVVDYIAFDRDNPSSIRSCVENARRNARSVRTALTSEMWESINSTWMEMNRLDPSAITGTELRNFLDWIKERVTLFRGSAYGTMIRDDAYAFVRLGTYVERGDNTARILDVKYNILLPPEETVGGAVDEYQWMSILRAVSAHRSFHWLYRTNVRPWLVAEFLILRPEMPRSLVACVGEVDTQLDYLAKLYGRRAECHRQAGQLHAQLTYGRTEDIFQAGLHEFLTDFIMRNARLSDEIQRCYLS